MVNETRNPGSRAIKPKLGVGDYAGKGATGKQSARVSREIKPSLKVLHSDGVGTPTRKGGGR